MNHKSVVKNAMKGRKMEVDLEKHSGWSAATAPMRKPGVSCQRLLSLLPHVGGGMRGFGEAVFRVRQSRCLWPPPQKRHGPIFASYGRSFPYLLFLMREAVSAFVVMAATLAAILEITSLRSSVEDKSPDEVCAAFETDFLRPSDGGEVSRSFIFEGQDVLANLVDKPERLVFLILLHGHREPERRPVPSLDCRGDEAQLEGLQLLVLGSFKDGDVR
jgi:hypothetical protein